MIYYSDENIDNIEKGGLFLAGPTPRDETTISWRIEALEYLKEYDGNIFIPERKNGWDNFDYVDQIDWELNAMDKSEHLMFWIPRNLQTMPAFTSNIEFGYNIKNRDFFYGRPDDAPKCRYLDVLYKKHKSLPILNSLKSLCEFIIMKQHFDLRTAKHIATVLNYSRKANSYYVDFQPNEFHDCSKLYEKIEMVPYIYTTWKYKMNGNYEIPEHIKQLTDEATFHHIKNNQHHPEYWDKQLINNPINTVDRDKPSDVLVDATSMPYNAIIEMCCDWCAVSAERQTNPLDWADMNINVRWKFNLKQTKLIYEVLNSLWVA